MRIAEYDSEHADEMRAVCLATASERARTDAAYKEFTLLMYCDPYLAHGTCLMLLDDDNVAQGYLLCCEDISSWQRDFAPYLKRIHALGPEYAERAQRETAYYETVADEYPAHLHIDIKEGFTGKGYGRTLMETMLARLRHDGVRGISFGVASSNARAISFYRAMGFTELVSYTEEGEGGITFCMRLCE